MSAFTPASQILARHETLFYDKNMIIAGDIHDDYAIQMDAKTVKIHCGSYHIYQMLLAKKRANQQIDFSILPPNDFYSQTESLIYYWSKNKLESQFQLYNLLKNSPQNADVFIVGENRSGIKSVEKLLNPLGLIQKIDGARRCSLYYFQLTKRPEFTPEQWWQHYALQYGNNKIDIFSLPGVFSQKEFDIGSQLLLDTVIEQAGLVKGCVLDVGCGSGVLSAVLGKLYPEINLTLCDVSAMALASSEKTLQKNQVNGQIIASDVFSEINGAFDLIISNPPFHEGRQTSYLAAEALISQAKKYLKPQGKLCIVANTFLPYQKILSEYFSTVDVLAQTTKFRIYLAY